MRPWKLVLSGILLLAAVGGAARFRDRLLPGATNVTAVAAPAAFAMPVPVAKVVKKTIPVYFDYAARTEAIRNLTLQAKVSGYLLQQHVADGSDVSKGDLLYTIDSRDFQAALDQAIAQSRRNAAALDYARANSDRGRELGKTGILAKDTVEQRVSAVRQSEAALAVDEAAVHTALLNLGYTEIRAPFDGRIGRNQAAIGTLVSAGGTALNTLVQLDKIYVTFNPSERDLVEIQKARATGTVAAEIILPGDNEAKRSGELTFVDNTVDRATGTIVARATIDNADRALLPGQYVRLRLFVTEQPDALMAPQAAVGSSQMGAYLFVVGEGDKAERRLVSLGRADGDLVAVSKGVSEGDRIITGNLQKISPGAPVQPIP